MNNATYGSRARSWAIPVLIVVQALVLAAIAVSYYAVGWYGGEIRLRTQPVDPRDILWGDYVTLHYEMNNLDTALWRGSGELPMRGDTVYVKVAPGSDGIASATGVYSAKPKAAGGEYVLKGRVAYSWSETINVEYGIEKYYVPEGTGKPLEDRADKLSVRVKVAPWGQAKIESLETTE